MAALTMTGTCLLLGVPLLLALAMHLLLWLRRIMALRFLPGPPTVPLLGNLFNFSLVPPEEGFRNMKAWFKKYGGVFKLWLGTTPIVICQDVQLIQAMLKHEDKMAKADMYPFMKQFIGDGMLTSETNERWKAHRRTISPSFHPEVLEGMVGPTVRKAFRLVEVLLKTQALSPTRPLDLTNHLKPAALDISMETVAGVESNVMDEGDDHPYLNAIDSISTIVMGRVFLPLLKYNMVFNMTSFKGQEVTLTNRLKHFSQQTVATRRTMLKETQPEGDSDEKKRKCLLDTLLNSNSGGLTDNDIEDELNTNIFAGFDTLWTSTSYTLYCLGHHPEIQARLVEELDREVPGLSEGSITLKDLSRLSLLDHCVKEALRLYPPAPMIGRRLLAPIDIKSGTLPEGVNVYINFYNYHRSAEVYSEPDEYQPDRWDRDQPPPHAFIPFGIGIRSCIGQKVAMNLLKILTAVLVKSMKVTSVERPEDLELLANLVLKSKTGFKVLVEPRQ